MECLCAKLAGRDMVLSPVCIGSLWIFENLGAAEIEALSEAAIRRKHAKGDIIFNQGEPARKMFLIKGGRIKLTKLTESGSEITLDIRKAGDFFGENMFIEETVFPVNAICLADTLVCGFTKKGFEDLVVKYPNIGLQVIRNLSKRIDLLTSRVGNMSYPHLEDRLYRVLAGVAREHGSQSAKGIVLDMPMTHEELSFLVGAHRVSITRAMKNLRESGKVIQEGRTLILKPMVFD